MASRKIVLGIGILISFVLLIFTISMYYDYQHDKMMDSRLTETQINEMSLEELQSHLLNRRSTAEKVFYNYYLIPLFAFVGVIVGTLIYYVMADRVVKQKKSSENNAKIILNFLNPDERKVIKELLEKDGKCPQYELTHLPNMNKVKTHRVIKGLEAKGVLKRENYGKINKIILDDSLYQVLKE